MTDPYALGDTPMIPSTPLWRHLLEVAFAAVLVAAFVIVLGTAIGWYTDGGWPTWQTRGVIGAVAFAAGVFVAVIGLLAGAE